MNIYNNSNRKNKENLVKITIINLKQIIKYIFIFFIIIISIGILKNKLQKKENRIEISLMPCLKYQLPIISSTVEIPATETHEKLSTKILSMQIGLLNNVNKKQEYEEIEVVAPPNENMEVANVESKEQVEQIIETNLEVKETTVIEEKNINATYTKEWNGIKVNNQTDFDITPILENPLYTFTNPDKVLIYHTHTCESYTVTEQYNYTMTDSYRTTDLNYTISRVGEELGKELEKRGFKVVHDKSYHDYPSYSGSYGRSLKTLQNMLASNSDTEITIDLHRDAVGSMNDYAPRVQIGDEVCAQIMFVVGTNGSGLQHDNWQENLKYAIKVQQKANELYPGLFRPIILREARYNQQLTTASTIIEVGATGNTLEECLNSMKYLAEVLEEVTQ